MADVYAVKSGNWSDTTLWNTGSLPAVIDDVYANTFTVYVDGNYQVSSVRNLSATSITRGGSFILNNGVSLSANVIGGGVDNVFCVRFLSAAPAFANITGNVSTSGSLVNVRQSFALELSSTGTLTVYGSAINGNNNASGTGVSDGYIQVNAPGTLNVFGDVRGTLNGNVYWAINNRAAGTVNVIGNVIARTIATGGVSLFAIHNNSTGTINVTGSILGGVENGCVGIYNNTTGTINVRGNVTGGLGPTANFGARGIFNNAAGTVNIIGDVAGGQQGHEGLFNNASTSVANVTGTVYGGYLVTAAGTIPGGSNGINNAGTLNVFGGAIGGAGASSYGIIHTGNAPTFTTIYGNISGFGGNSSGVRNNATGTVNIIGNTYGGQGTSTPGTWNASTGITNLTGNCYGYGFIPINLNFAVNGTGGYGIHESGSGTVNVRGDVFSSNLRGDAWGIFNQNSGTVTVIGNVYGGAATNAYGVNNGNTTTITVISGSAIGGIGSAAYGAFNNSTGILRVKRAVGNDWGLGYTTALASTPGVFSNNQGSRTFVEELELGPRGQWPTGGVIFFTPNTKATSMFETDTFQNYSLIQSNSADNLVPPVSSVRQGDVYNLGDNTGTCIIPPVSSVATDTPVDNTFGTAVLTPQDTWNTSVTGTDIDSMGGRLRNALNSNAAEKLINSFSS